jgi:hypothetical protein
MGLMTRESVTALQTNDKEFRLVAGLLLQNFCTTYTTCLDDAACSRWPGLLRTDERAPRARIYTLSG